ncbi:MAG: NnrU family protein [Planctomycetaceae bacterium]
MSYPLSSSSPVPADTGVMRRSDGTTDATWNWKRMAGFAFGIGTQAFFAVTVVGLFSFLRYGVDAPSNAWILTDTVLSLQFVIPHSILLHPRFRTWFRERFPMEMHGAFFCVCTCVSLVLIFAFWKSSPTTIWQLEGWSASVVTACFYASWAALLYSISLTGLGFQTGLTQWLHWYRQEKMPRRNFEARGLYHVLRHPVYLSFLGLIWFTPTMTADHAVLTGIWTVYIFAGSVLKDQRLKFYLGDAYEKYMAKVPGYPLMIAGPLARVPVNSVAADMTIAVNSPTADAGSERRKVA